MIRAGLTVPFPDTGGDIKRWHTQRQCASGKGLCSSCRSHSEGPHSPQWQMVPPPGSQCSSGHPPALLSQDTYGAIHSTSSGVTCLSTCPPVREQIKDLEFAIRTPNPLLAAPRKLAAKLKCRASSMRLKQDHYTISGSDRMHSFIHHLTQHYKGLTVLGTLPNLRTLVHMLKFIWSQEGWMIDEFTMLEVRYVKRCLDSALDGARVFWLGHFDFFST